KQRKLGRGVAIVGAGMSRFGMFKDKDSKDLFADAFREMMASVDKGMDPSDIDALYLGNFSNDFFVDQAHWAPIISDLIGHAPKPATRTEGACASSALAFREGVFAIASGFYDMVLVGGVEEMSKRTTEEVAQGLALATVPYEGRVGFTFPGVFGTLATAYFAKYGANHEHLMNITIKSHNNAPLNPKAQFNVSIRDIMNAKKESAQKKGKPIPEWSDEKDFLRDSRANPSVAWPMHLYDCCPISDGASCMLLVGEELARNFTDDPLYIVGMGQGSGRGFHASKALTYFEATRYAA
ncbi:MAG: hypothetical protein GY846_02165, partial [Deltaproteobacteria bacterium]|nr:hypothetical protein [Deltaproteobacteria bacterium]